MSKLKEVMKSAGLTLDAVALSLLTKHRGQDAFAVE
jgi:hypothetical protein